MNAINGLVLTDVITSASIQGVMDEIVGLLPVVVPVLISLLAIRKAIAFVMGELRGA